MKEEKLKEEIKEEIKQEEQRPRLLKKFEIVDKTSDAGRRYFKLVVTSHGDTACELFMTESQVAVVDIVGKENCFVDIQTRKSKDNKPYNVVALVCGEDTFDYFPKDRAFITLAKLQAQKLLNK